MSGRAGTACGAPSGVRHIFASGARCVERFGISSQIFGFTPVGAAPSWAAQSVKRTRAARYPGLSALATFPNIGMPVGKGSAEAVLVNPGFESVRLIGAPGRPAPVRERSVTKMPAGNHSRDAADWGGAW